jgi:hypothetical protein
MGSPAVPMPVAAAVGDTHITVCEKPVAGLKSAHSNNVEKIIRFMSIVLSN